MPLLRHKHGRSSPKSHCKMLPLGGMGELRHLLRMYFRGYLLIRSRQQVAVRQISAGKPKVPKLLLLVLLICGHQKDVWIP